MFYILLTWVLAPIWWPVALIRRLLTPEPRRILFMEIAGIGDVVCSAALFQAIRDQHPKALIDLLIDPIAASMAPILPMVNEVRLFAYPEQKGFKGRLKLASLCAQYDTVICLVPSAAQLTAFCWGALPRRLSILPPHLNNSYRLLAPLMTGTQQHVDGQYFPGTQFQLCQQFVSPAASSEKKLNVTTSFQANQLPEALFWVGLLISSGRALKRLSDEQLGRIVQGLINIKASKPVGVVLLGGPGDKAQAAQVIQRMAMTQSDANLVDTVGQYQLAELPKVLSQLKVLLGVDSGVTHMADALGVPVVCIAGPVDLNEVYQPSAKRQLFKSDLPCYPCSTVFNTPNSCKRGDRACLDNLSVAHLLSAAASLVNQNHGR